MTKKHIIEVGYCKYAADSITAGSASFVRMFKPQFAALVESGKKLQTVRPTPKRMPKPGDRISLRCWTDKPYRSKQRVLRESIITSVDHCDITETGVTVNSLSEPAFAFAEADGFRDFFDLRDWFRETHGLPFEGVLIRWQNVQVVAPPTLDSDSK